MKSIPTDLIQLFSTLSGCATDPLTGDQDFALVPGPGGIERGHRYHRIKKVLQDE